VVGSGALVGWDTSLGGGASVGAEAGVEPRLQAMLITTINVISHTKGLNGFAFIPFLSPH
jgi:hypothetical protein